MKLALSANECQSGPLWPGLTGSRRGPRSVPVAAHRRGAGAPGAGHRAGAVRQRAAVQAELRRTAPPAVVAAALSQVELRERARAKFGELADRMYFTPDALEQATRLSVATHRAGRYQAFGAHTLIDLGCGIGGDLIAGARAGLVCAGVDLDPVRVAVAEANLAALGLPGAVQVADATTVHHEGFDLAFADPARRSGAGRTFNVDDWVPPWTWVEGLLRRDACVKVAPGIPHALVPADVEAEWVSDGGEVKEAALWSGRTATARRRATSVDSGQAGWPP